MICLLRVKTSHAITISPIPSTRKKLTTPLSMLNTRVAMPTVRITNRMRTVHNNVWVEEEKRPL